MEDGPEFSDIGGEGDVGVEDDDPVQVGGEGLGEHQLHQTVDPRVVLVGDPGHLRLQRKTKTQQLELTSLTQKLITKKSFFPFKHNFSCFLW